VLVALDNSASRLQRITENLQRLKLHAQLICGDATQPQQWWDQQLFDRILLDAPCSATGVIRRHPEIKWQRQAEDVQKIVILQQQLLAALWPLLTRGGRFVYATCSVLPQENHLQISHFLETHPDARQLLGSTGMQLLPGENDMDGFYYAVLEKSC